MDTLLYVLNGEDSISPYNYVSFRIIQRIADVLMNFGIDDPVFDPFLPGVDVLQILKENYRENFKKRKQREREYWQEPEKALIDRIKQGQHTKSVLNAGENAFYHSFFRQHYWFTSNNGIPILRMFLTKKVALCEQWLKMEYDKGYDKHALTLKQAMTRQVKKAEAKELWHREQEEIKKSSPIEVPLPKKHGAEADEDPTAGLKVLKRALMMEEVGQHYDPERSVDHLTL